MKPTIGRIVHYHRPAFPDRDTIVTSAAIITGIDHEHGIVSLTVFLDEKTSKGRGKTLYLSGVAHCEGDVPVAYGWSWPPKEAS